MSAHKLTKKEMKHDGFVESTEKGLEFLQKHAMTIGIGLLAVVVAIVGGTYFAQSRSASHDQASYLLYQGEGLMASGAFEAAMAPLQECVDRYGSTDFGHFARAGLAKAFLASGEYEAALASMDQWLGSVPDDHPADRALRKLRAAALGATGRHGEAATAFGELATSAEVDSEIYELTVLQSEQLRDAGQAAEALRLLEGIDNRRKSGDLELPVGADLDVRIEVLRALS